MRISGNVTLVSSGAGRWRAVGSVVLALVIAACSTAGTVAPTTGAGAPKAATPQPTASGPTAANPVTVTIVTVSNVLYSPIFVGVEKGIFLKHGIDLKVNVVTTGADSIKSLQGGTGQLTGEVWATIAPAFVQGVPLKVFYLVMSRPDIPNYDRQFVIMARPGIAATKVADLKGLRVGLGIGGGGELWTRAQLLKAGLNPDTDTTLVNVSSPNALAALTTQSVDVAEMVEPYSTVIASSLAGSREVTRGGGVSESRLVLTALGSWLTQNPVVADSVVAAQLEANQYVRQHPSEAAVSASHFITGSDPKILEIALQKLDFDPRWSSKVQDGFDFASQLLLTNKTIQSLPKTTDILALDILTGYEKKYPQYFSDLK